ncbi:hypothetical protein HGM15179_009763 [Zosterops borbonicus]|uniref:Uncharacterized protein n=1 Tax=Zosterops borbonicus TaxID=364589 RepID=A0A8K1GFX2_9PASS|nr:hypothetical protein HGM15179_009763 [Zosterops borbonicus]
MVLRAGRRGGWCSQTQLGEERRRMALIDLGEEKEKRRMALTDREGRGEGEEEDGTHRQSWERRRRGGGWHSELGEEKEKRRMALRAGRGKGEEEYGTHRQSWERRNRHRKLGSSFCLAHLGWEGAVSSAVPSTALLWLPALAVSCSIPAWLLGCSNPLRSPRAPAEPSCCTDVCVGYGSNLEDRL